MLKTSKLDFAMWVNLPLVRKKNSYWRDFEETRNKNMESKVLRHVLHTCLTRPWMLSSQLPYSFVSSIGTVGPIERASGITI